MNVRVELSIFSEKNIGQKRMNSPRNDVCNLLVDSYVQIKIYREFFHGIIYTTNEGTHAYYFISTAAKYIAAEP
jgi:hypothetical protein